MLKNIKSVLVICFKSAIIFIMFLILTTNFLQAQDTLPKKVDKPVYNTFNSGVFMENVTYLCNSAKTIENVINHRFGKISDGSKMGWGIYSPSNIRFGMNYSILDNLQIGIGFTKFYKQFDGNIKYNFIQQTRSGKIPVAVTYYGNFVFDGRETSAFNNPDFKEAHRFSYFHEILISRKFCESFNLQIAPMLTYFNLVETSSYNVLSTTDTLPDPVRKNLNFGLSVLGKVNINSTWGFLFEYDYNFTKLIKETDTYKNPKANVSIGIEKATAAHSFQIFLTTAADLTNQRNMVYNQNQFIGKGDSEHYFNTDVMIGFNLTRIF